MAIFESALCISVFKYPGISNLKRSDTIQQNISYKVCNSPLKTLRSANRTSDGCESFLLTRGEKERRDVARSENKLASASYHLTPGDKRAIIAPYRS